MSEKAEKYLKQRASEPHPLSEHGFSLEVGGCNAVESYLGWYNVMQAYSDQENANKDERILGLQKMLDTVHSEINRVFKGRKIIEDQLKATQAKLDAANEQLTKNAKDHLATVQKYVDLRSGLNAIVRIKQADNVYLWDHDIQALLTAAKSDQTK